MSRKIQVQAISVTGTRGIFGAVPCEILSRADVLPVAKLTLMAMGVVAKGTGRAWASDAVYGNIAGLSRTGVIKGRQQLADLELIRQTGREDKQIQEFELLHPWYVTRPEEPQAGSDLRRRGEWIACPVCGHKRPGLLRVGYCRSCKTDKRMERISRRVVKEEIAAGKTA